MLDLYDELPGLLKKLREQRREILKIIELKPQNEVQRQSIETLRGLLIKIHDVLYALGGDN